MLVPMVMEPIVRELIGLMEITGINGSKNHKMLLLI